MRIFNLLLLISLSTLVIACSSSRRDFVVQAQSGGSSVELPADIVPLDDFVQIDLRVPIAPGVMPSGGKNYLVYELFVSNLIPIDYQLDKVDVINADTQELVRSFSGSALRELLRLGGEIPTPVSEEPVLLKMGVRSTIFFFLDFPGAEPVPQNLAHRLFVTTPDDGQVILNGEETVAVDQTPPLVLSPPISGGPWKCDGAPSADSYHRRTLLAINGVARVSQRFAIDFELLTPSGETFAGDPTVNTNYPCYGEPIFASRTGTVVKVIDGLPDNTPPQVPSRGTVDEVGGNGVILDVGDGKFIVHGHMQPGSIPAQIQVGANVAVGQQLGRIGNSGNSFEPHLHIQVCDKPSFLGAQGLPYVFDGYNLLEGVNSTAKTNELPLLNQVVEFPTMTVARARYKIVASERPSRSKCAWH